MSFRLCKIFAPVLLILAVENVEAQTWGQHGVTVHVMPSAFNLAGWNIVNNLGQVAGYNTALGGGIFSAGSGVTYFAPGSPTLVVQPMGINDHGHVAGYTRQSGIDRAFIYNGTSMHTVEPAGASSSWAYDINASGVIAGYAATSSLSAYIGDLSSVVPLGTVPGAFGSMAWAINDLGQVTGRTLTSTGQYAFLYSGGTMQDIGTLGGNMTYAFDINNAGQVVGYSRLAGDPTSPINHAMVYSGGVMTDLGTLGGLQSAARNIDATGRIVGLSNVTNGNFAAAVWESIGGVYAAFALDQLVNDGVINSGWVFGEARSISDNGRYIAAFGSNRSLGITPGWMLLEANAPATVTPEPMTFVLLGTGLAGLFAVRRRKKKSEIN